VGGVECGHCFLQAAVAARLAPHGGANKHEAMAHDGGLKQLDHLQQCDLQLGKVEYVEPPMVGPTSMRPWCTMVVKQLDHLQD